jgi:hypothetical protein
METMGYKPAAWIYEMLAAGNNSFYLVKDGRKKYYEAQSKTYKDIEGTENFILLDTIRENKTVWKNKGATLTDIGDGILNLEFHTKMNTIGSEIIGAMNSSIELAGSEYTFKAGESYDSISDGDTKEKDYSSWGRQSRGDCVGNSVGPYIRGRTRRSSHTRGERGIEEKR